MIDEDFAICGILHVVRELYKNIVLSNLLYELVRLGALIVKYCYILLAKSK